jgi:xanthosine utilization system XapX-like protein
VHDGSLYGHDEVLRFVGEKLRYKFQEGRQRMGEVTGGRKTFHSLLYRSVVPVAASLLALAGVIVGAQIASDATREAALIQGEMTVASDHREKIGQVYAAYLDAANNYSVATEGVLDAFEGLDDVANQASEDPVVAQELAAFEDARHAYQGAINDLYVYGSDVAWAAHTSVAVALPPALGVVEGRSIERVDRAEFTSAYRDFQKAFCREATAEPREGCFGS